MIFANELNLIRGRYVERKMRRDDKANHGNTHLPFGLCKKYGIEIEEGWTPYDAWEALEWLGIDPDEEYAKLSEKEKAEYSEPYEKKTEDNSGSKAKQITDSMQKNLNGTSFSSYTKVVEDLNDLPTNSVISYVDKSGEKIVLKKQSLSGYINTKTGETTFTMMLATNMKGAKDFAVEHYEEVKKPKPKDTAIDFDEDAYDSERKENAQKFGEEDKNFNSYKEDVYFYLDLFEKKGVDFLKPAQKEAVEEYTKGTYTDINKTLSGRMKAIDYVINDVNDITQALQGAGFDGEDIYVQTGMSRSKFKAIFGVDITDAAEGIEGHNKAFTSTSFGPTPFVDIYDVIIDLYCPDGTECMHIGRVSEYEHENEVLLQRGTSMKINKVTVKDGKYYVSADVTGRSYTEPYEG